MTTTIFDSISHADFLRLTLQAFARQGYAVEPSRAADADGVLLGKNGGRIAVLCKKYRGAFIGRPVLQQFHGAMLRLGCKEGYLITTTDCSPEACEFAAGKGIVLYNGEGTTELLRKAFGDEFIRSGRMPDLGRTAKPAPPAARKPASVASYEKVAVPEIKKAPEPAEPPEPVKAPEPAAIPEPVHVPEPVQVPEPVPALEQVPAPEPEQEPVPELETVPELLIAPELETVSEPGQAPLLDTVLEELPEEVQEVQELQDLPELQEALEPQEEQSTASPGAAAEALAGKTTIIVCLECNKQLQVPIDQGMITVQCPECGMRRLYQPELNDAGELKTTTVITCKSCSQKLNVPTNRGQLNVRCPQCKAAWVFTP